MCGLYRRIVSADWHGRRKANAYGRTGATGCPLKRTQFCSVNAVVFDNPPSMLQVNRRASILPGWCRTAHISILFCCIQPVSRETDRSGLVATHDRKTSRREDPRRAKLIPPTTRGTPRADAVAVAVRILKAKRVPRRRGHTRRPPAPCERL